MKLKTLSEPFRIEGEIILDNGNNVTRSTTYIRIEDMSRADAPSKNLAERILRNSTFIQKLDKYVLPFNISLPFFEKNKMYSISVHVDANENGKIDKGDYINMENYPVPLQGFNDKVEIKVRRIK
jgi:uncharacterized lipoprotein YbaY